METPKFVYVAQQQVGEILVTAPTPGKTQIEPFHSFMKSQGAPFSILEDTAVESNKVELHTDEEDVWVCLQGEAWFKLGGEMVDPFPSTSGGAPNVKEMRSQEVQGATTVIMKPGEWLWIPAGVPHQHGASGTARFMVFKCKPKA